MRRVRVHRDLPVPMSDGEILLADHYVPEQQSAPTILVRSPMGRRPLGIAYGHYFARHGFHVVVQSARESADVLPLTRERSDGIDTLEWLRAQPWFNGTLLLHGMSAMGFSHWAVVAQAPELAAMSVHVASSSIADTIFVGGSTALESLLIWCSNHSFTTALAAPWRARRAIRSGRPLTELDVLTGGRTVPFYQAVMTDSGPGSELRDKLSHRTAPDGPDLPPIHLVAGWHDIFLPGQLRDYLALRDNGAQPHLTIGPWAHYDPRLFLTANREALQWFRAHTGSPISGGIRALPVHLYVTGARTWRQYSQWPPPRTASTSWYLHQAGGLSPRPPEDCVPDGYRYTPADPTPAPRGPVIVGDSRPGDCRRLDRRPDVLVYTSAILADAMEVIGAVAAELHVSSSRPQTDFVVRLCDVYPDGRSVGICEGVQRVDLVGPDRIRIELWPIAHRFAAGHRLRVQVCSSAMPRYTCHPDAADQRVFHDPRRPSAILLPTTTR